MSGPCKLCPFRKDVPPYLTKQRGVQLAMLTRNRVADFTCHESIKSLGGIGPRRTCIGFATLRAQEAGGRFVKPDELVYQTMGEMIAAYLEKGS